MTLQNLAHSTAKKQGYGCRTAVVSTDSTQTIIWKIRMRDHMASMQIIENLHYYSMPKSLNRTTYFESNQIPNLYI